MELLKLISGQGFVMYSKLIARKVSANASIIYGQLASSHESFGNKNMLTKIHGKEYFFLTADVIEIETSLTYRQQTKAIKELEEFGLIKTVLRGVPAKKHFHLTDQIQDLFISNSSYDKSAELDKTDDSSIDKRLKLELTKEQHKNEQNVPCIKKNKEKEQYKENNNLLTIVNREIADNLVLEYIRKGLSKDLAFRVVEEVNRKADVDNYGGYLRACLETTFNRWKRKQSYNQGELPDNPFDDNHPLSYFHDYIHRIGEDEE